MEYSTDASITAENLPEQFSIVGKGAQYLVAMLSGPEVVHQEFTRQGAGRSRVLKLPLPREYVQLAVEAMDVSEAEKQQKVDDLTVARTGAAFDIPELTFYNYELYDILGRPRFAAATQFTPRPSQLFMVTIGSVGSGKLKCGVYPAYTQDYCPTITPLVTSEPNTKEGRLLMQLIDNYADMQNQIIKSAVFDDIFKLDNYGIPTYDCKLRMNDFSELQTDSDVVEDAIRTRKWESITENTEYTQMTPDMQDYFNATMAKKLTLKSMDSWGVALSYEDNATLSWWIPDIVFGSAVERMMFEFDKSMDVSG